MIIIASAAYVNSEFQIEFGRVPPSFLPIGNLRLFEKQILLLSQEFPKESIYMSIPKSYELPYKDGHFLKQNNIKVLRSNELLPLADSISFALESIENPDEHLRILHGDTLLTDIPIGLDLIALAHTKDDYAWEVETSDFSTESIWCGYFSFSNSKLLKELLSYKENNFVEAIKCYDSKIPLKRQFVEKWYDFGHINTYFQNRARITTERVFNSLTIEDGYVLKTGLQQQKIAAEGDWFKALPKSIRSYCPQLLDSGIDEKGQAYYKLEYLPLPPLNELFVHGRNPLFFWNKVFDLCNEFLNCCHTQIIESSIKKRIEDSMQLLMREKTFNRFQEFSKQSNFPGLDATMEINGYFLPTLRSIINHCINKIENNTFIHGIVHGDFCLSNILFDSRRDRIKVIDPRALDAFGNFTIFGDLSYDLAKLTHSVVGLYDHIISGAFDIDWNIQPTLCSFNLEIFIDDRIKSIQAIFMSKKYINRINPLQVMPMTILLFLSMLPLHSDNSKRQMALLANALRLYNDFILNNKDL